MAQRRNDPLAPRRAAGARMIASSLGKALPELLTMSFFINLLALASPIFVMQVYDRVIALAGLTTLEALVLGMLAIIVLDFVLRQARSRILQNVALAIDIDLGRRLFNKFAGLPLRVLESRSGHTWLFMFRDVETVRNTLSGALVIAFVDLPFVIMFLGFVVWLAPPLAWVFVSVSAAFVLLAVWNAFTVSRASQTERQAIMSRDRLLNEIVLGRATMKALAISEPMRKAWEESHAASIESSLVRGRRADGSTNFGQSLGIIATTALTAAGAMAILDLKMTVGGLVAANLLAGRFIAPLTQLVTNWRTFAGFRDSARRLSGILAAPGERVEKAMDLPRPDGWVKLENVTFRYAHDEAPVLDDVTVRFGPGGLHAIDGANGSGKTTLLKILQGLYAPAEGRVLLDGGDIAQFPRAQAAEWIGFVPQDGFLFNGTIRDNIARFRGDLTDAQILEATKISGAHDFIASLPSGYATELGEGGAGLSTGQRQRIAIARALVSNPPIIVMDEPTGNLDRDAEMQTRAALRRLAADHTVIVATHSTGILQVADSVTVLGGGRIVLAGKADQVLPKLIHAAQ
jgi:ATP-binding cassette subfamily C protein LapB